MPESNQWPLRLAARRARIYIAGNFSAATTLARTAPRVRAASGQLHLDSRSSRFVDRRRSSAYAASAVASAWPHAVAVPTTELLIGPEPYLDDVDAVISSHALQ